MTIFQFFLASLACYRLTILVARDLGPFDIFKAIRGLPLIGHLVGCPFCISIWIALGIEVAFFFSGVRECLVVSALQVFAMSAVTIALDRIFTADHNPI